MYATIILTTILTLTSAFSIIPRQSSSGACNNSPALCGKSYSKITHLGAHDSPFVRDATTGHSSSGNQYYNTTVQLDAGVRLVSAQVHKTNNQWHLCHSSCDLLDAGTLSDWLGHIKTWLDSNPNDVVTILLVNSDDAKVTDLHGEFKDANIVSYAYRPTTTTTPQTSWPTLQELISANTRLMVFVASLNPATITSETSYIMDEFTFIFENPYQNNDVKNFTCSPERPSAIKGNSAGAISSGRMAFTNHFLYDTSSFGSIDISEPNTAQIGITNSPQTTSQGQLGFALQSCRTEYGQAPTFVLVDFFDEGPAISAVDAINGITPTGRKTLPARDTTTGRGDSTFARVESLVQSVKEGKAVTKGAWIWAAGKWTLGGINMNGGDLIG